MLLFFYFLKRKEGFLIHLLPLFFIIFSAINSYSQKDSAFVYYQKNNVITELLFSSAGFSGKDLNRQNAYYVGIAIYSKIGYTVFDRINIGILGNYFFSKSNVLQLQTPSFYQLGGYARYVFRVRPKISFFVESSYSFCNACYVKDNFNIVVNRPEFQYFSPGAGFNFRILKLRHLFGTVSVEQIFSINNSACNRNGYAIKFGLNYYFKP